MKLRRSTILQLVFAFLVVAALIGWDLSLSGRRHEIYSIFSELRPGMPRNEVLTAIKSKAEPHVNIAVSKEDGSIFAYVHVGFVDSAYISINFKNGRLAKARISGENGPNDRFPDAPPDIIATEEQLNAP